MRRARGNVILTSLFIAIFLFFLSVALIWTNRQDIALSLSMEHKLKAQSAARSAAYEAFARLRQFGELGGFSSGVLEGGAGYNVELVSLDSLGRRGEVLLVRARGKSGPVTSYLTLHLRDTRLAGPANESDPRVLFFPGESGGKALYGTFELTDGGDGVVAGMVAQQGPAFVADSLGETEEDLEGSLEPETVDPEDLSELAVNPSAPPGFKDFAPVFTPDGQSISGWGPLVVVAPKFAQMPAAVTALRYLKYEGEDFDWVEIDPPVELGSGELDELGGFSRYDMEASPRGDWNTAVLQGVDAEVRTFSWLEDEPPTESVSELAIPPMIAGAAVVGGLVDWSSVQKFGVQERFTTRGVIAARGRDVYTHGWHYVYEPYNGSPPGAGNINPLVGAKLTRWPCILKYTVDGSWSEVWTPLQQDGSVGFTTRPDPEVLLVSENGTVFTVSENGRRLMTITADDTAALGEVVPPGDLLVYKGVPHLIPAQPTEPGIVNLLNNDIIGFETLPDRLPELFGEVVDTRGTESLIIGMEGGYSGEPLDSTKRLIYTARPRVDFEYSIAPGSNVAVDGDDLWANITVNVFVSDPTHEQGYTEPPFTQGPRNVLARYDGTRWHILPNGLRTALSSGLSAPGNGVVAAEYAGLPPAVSRYSVISVDTNPF